MFGGPRTGSRSARRGGRRGVVSTSLKCLCEKENEYFQHKKKNRTEKKGKRKRKRGGRRGVVLASLKLLCDMKRNKQIVVNINKKEITKNNAKKYLTYEKKKTYKIKSKENGFLANRAPTMRVEKASMKGTGQGALLRRPSIRRGAKRLEIGMFPIIIIRKS